jgi:hypothetical protein
MVSTNIVTNNGTTNIAITNNVHLFHRGREREGGVDMEQSSGIGNLVPNPPEW